MSYWERVLTVIGVLGVLAGTVVAGALIAEGVYRIYWVVVGP